MHDPREFIRVLFDCFDKSAREDFRRFVGANKGVTKWHVAADFCLHDKERPNDSFAFSLIPYDAYTHELFQEIKTSIPKDLKSTRDIRDQSIAFLREDRRFHFTFVFAEAPAVFDNGNSVEDSLKIARQSIDLSIAALQTHGRSKENLRRLKLLKQAAQAKQFNVGLAADLYVFSYLICFVSLALARETNVEILGWFADRDSMNTWCDGVVWDIAAESLHGFAQHLGIDVPHTAPLVAAPDPTKRPQDEMWYDEFVRIPDYFAGILAAWNLDQNVVPGDREKYRKLSRELIADSQNTAIFRVRYLPSKLLISRCVFSLDANSGSLSSEDGKAVLAHNDPAEPAGQHPRNNGVETRS